LGKSTDSDLKAKYEIVGFLRDRFSKDDFIYIFTACAIPIHIWGILNLFIDIPSWLLNYNFIEIIAGVAYTLVFSLVETSLVFIGVVTFRVLLPKRWAADWFVSFSILMVLELNITALLFQYFTVQGLYYKTELLVASAVSIGLTVLLVSKINRLNNLVRLIASRFTILAYVYVFFDIVGLIIVIVRNI
jgi:hypothetical protein